MAEISETAVTEYRVTKNGHRYNPRSLDNLQTWQPGQSGNPIGRPANAGPMVTPAMRHLAALKPEELEALKDSGELNTAQMIALTALLDALTTGPFTTGKQSRDAVMNRLDGEPEKQGPAIAVQVNLTFNDGEQA